MTSAHQAQPASKPSAQRVIDILRVIQQELSPAHTAYWVTPNTVLTLSGARAYCDAVFWDNDDKPPLKKWTQDITDSLTILKNQLSIVAAEVGMQSVRSNERYVSYDVITADGLDYTLHHTSLVAPEISGELLKQATTADVVKVVADNLLPLPSDNDYSDESRHHVAVGILLGYPDLAIINSVDEWQQDDPFAEPLINADIRGAAYYACPQPIYLYPRHLIADQQIIAHEQLWSTILREYYGSDFHKALEADPGFIQKMTELKNFR